MSSSNFYATEMFRQNGHGLSDGEAPDPRWTAADRRIAELEQQVSDMENEKATLRQSVVAEIRTAAEESAAMNQRLQAFNAEITPDMDGAAIKRLAKKHGL